jgi:UDP-N-acetylglucosamine:LPS N-acetylglucosamine transferase
MFDVIKVIWLTYKYKPVGLIATGPGSVLISAILFKILNKKIVFIETRARITTKSITARIMYRISNRFYVQNKELINLYPNAIYAGLL